MKQSKITVLELSCDEHYWDYQKNGWYSISGNLFLGFSSDLIFCRDCGKILKDRYGITDKVSKRASGWEQKYIEALIEENNKGLFRKLWEFLTHEIY